MISFERILKDNSILCKETINLINDLTWDNDKNIENNRDFKKVTV